MASLDLLLFFFFIKKIKLEGQTLGDNSCKPNPSGYRKNISNRHHPIQMFKKATIMAIKPEIRALVWYVWVNDNLKNINPLRNNFTIVTKTKFL